MAAEFVRVFRQYRKAGHTLKTALRIAYSVAVLHTPFLRITMENKQVAAALVKAQRAFGPALKTHTNPAFRSKYADLSACVEAVIDALNANGIALIQKQHPHEGGVAVETLFVHESGESLSTGVLTVPASKQDPQGYGSALTYARRYSLMAACGIAPEDDDGNAASAAKKTRTAHPARAKWLADWLAAIDASANVGELRQITADAIASARSENDADAEAQFTAAQAAKLESQEGEGSSMSSMNKAIIIGRIGRDPEVRYSPSGSVVCNATVATSRSWTNKESGERQEETEWHRVVFYDRLAEVVGEYVKKGALIAVEGRLKTRKWQDKEGKDNYTTEIVASEMQMLSGKQGSEPASQEKPRQKTHGEMRKPSFDLDDDIPF